MPTITATPFPNVGHVLVQANWGDVPYARCIQVVRVRVDTGEETPLRPYIYPCGEAGEFIVASDHKAIFWDTEAPLDTSFFYRTRSAEFTAVDHSIRDSFSRINVDTWNNADTLQPWTVEATAANWDVNGTVGTVEVGAVNNSRRGSIGDNINDADVYVDFQIPVTATGADIHMAAMTRYLDTGNMYRYQLEFETAGTVTLSIIKRVGAVDTSLGTLATGLAYAPGDWFRVRGRNFGSTHMAKVWRRGTPEPAAWMLTGTPDATLLTGKVGIRIILSAGNTNALPVVFQVDNFFATVDFTGFDSDVLTLPSDEGFWLRDPVRPCNDRRVELCYAPHPACLPGPGIFFVEMGTESYPNNGTLVNPSNAKFPIPVRRQRRDADSTLTLATRMFTDRDALIETLAPGGELLFSGPPNYGIPDRYMFVPPVDIGRVSPDHRYQPRLHQLPYTTVARPVGTTQGVCGSRFMDLCAVYATWDEMAAAGITGTDILAGAAGGVVDTGFRTWDEVDAEFADWDAVAANGTWDDLMDGG